jgi:hypothetical protein
METPTIPTPSETPKASLDISPPPDELLSSDHSTQQKQKHFIIHHSLPGIVTFDRN